jgi:hypothetical protein
MRAPFRRRDVATLEWQRRKIEALSAAVESLVGERSHAWPASGERAASARLDELSAKLDRLLAERDETDAHSQFAHRQVYVSELSELGEVRARRIARRRVV